MTDNPTVGQRVRIMRHTDLERVLAWRNHPDIRRYMYTQHEIGLPEHHDWFNSAAQDPCQHLLIFELRGTALGFIKFSQLAGSSIADWGFYIAPDAPQGSGRQLGNSACEYAFQQLDLHKICGQALELNERSINFHRRMGFQQEGFLRDQHFDGEHYHSIICFGLLRSEWQPNLGKPHHE
jgi:UDP-4-amino-4,6-dideoxy-N-acetyl-beta-L-altrosamine N-acetyltransferase